MNPYQTPKAPDPALWKAPLVRPFIIRSYLLLLLLLIPATFAALLYKNLTNQIELAWQLLLLNSTIFSIVQVAFFWVVAESSRFHFLKAMIVFALLRLVLMYFETPFSPSVISRVFDLLSEFVVSAAFYLLSQRARFPGALRSLSLVTFFGAITSEMGQHLPPPTGGLSPMEIVGILSVFLNIAVIVASTILHFRAFWNLRSDSFLLESRATAGNP